MITLSPSAIAALDSLGSLKPGPAQLTLTKLAKAARREARWEEFNRTIRAGLRFSRQAAGARRAPQGDGGAVSEWRLKRIIP